MHDSSHMHEMGGVALNYTLRQPLGVAACISPWNLPLYLLTWKIAPALAAGNTVVAKPSEVTPMTAYLFSKICIEAGFPKGVSISHSNLIYFSEWCKNEFDISAKDRVTNLNPLFFDNSVFDIYGGLFLSLIHI